MKFKKLIAMALLIPTVLTGCTSKSQAPESAAPEQMQKLSVGVMPAVDTAPIFLAQSKGYFEQLGLDLEIVVFNNGQERQTALQTDAIDGAMTDIIAVATNVDGGFNLKATTLTDGVFPVLVREGYTETKDIKVGMMEVSVSNYLIDEWLSKDYNIEKVFINEIPARLEMIKSGQIDMGLFPEPMATNATADGLLEKRIYAPADGICPDVMAFTEKALSEKEEAIKLFHEGYNMGVIDIQTNEEEARTILIDSLGLNPEIKDEIILPQYTQAHLPSEEYVQQIIDWVKSDLKQTIEVDPSELVDARFVK